MQEYIPYTYLIGWTAQDIWYYGSETGCKGKIANPHNLWTTYFTSSKHVRNFRKIYGDPDVIQIRKTFSDRISAIRWEEKVLTRLNVIHDSRWLNLSTTKVHFRNGISHSEETKKKMSESRKKFLENNSHPSVGNLASAATKKLLSSQRMGRRWYNDGENQFFVYPLNARPEWNVGRFKPTEETKKKMSESKQGKKRSESFCISRTGSNNIMYGTQHTSKAKEKIRMSKIKNKSERN